MKTIILFIPVILLLTVACSEKPDPSSIYFDSTAKQEMQSGFIHMVFLDLKDSLSLEELDLVYKGILTLDSIEVVHDFSAGFFKSMNDARALNDVDLCFQMRFSNDADYELYQRDERHLEMKKNVAFALNGPPKVFDYTLK